MEDFMSSPNIIFMKITDYDLSGFPKKYQNIKAEGFKEYLKNYVTEDYGANGLFAKVNIELDTIVIEEDKIAENQANEALRALELGIRQKGKDIFEALYKEYQKNINVLYNLGMLCSDEGDLSRAIRLLSDLVIINPKHIYGWVALAVAYMRSNQINEANNAAQKALELDPNDSYVLRTAGYIASKLEDSGALHLLHSAVSSNPEDPIALLSLAEHLLNQKKPNERISALLLKIIDIAPGSRLAERAQDILRQIAYDEFRISEGLNQEVVTCCVDTLIAFKEMSDKEIGGVAVETATIGESGIDIQNTDKLYQLKTLPGQYTGLKVVSIMYCALKHIMPNQDCGFDIESEYKEALKNFNNYD
jgi:tetratricopeptide (TPR) repeat protein